MVVGINIKWSSTTALEVSLLNDVEIACDMSLPKFAEGIPNNPLAIDSPKFTA